MKTQLSLAILSLALALASACAQDNPRPEAGSTQPATEGGNGQEIPDVKDGGQDPNFDPSQSPNDVDKNSDPGNGDSTTVKERRVTMAFDAEKLPGGQGEAVVITIDHKKVTSSAKCASPIEHTPIGESGYDPEATTLVVEVSSHAAVTENQDTIRPDFEVSQTFTYTCGKGPLSVVMQNMETGHEVTVNLTIHTAEASVYAETKPFVALNEADGEQALTLEYPAAD
jgi:hypothetical protein